jgi:hypothetical protein
MQSCLLIRIVAPSTASATCLLADLVPFARARAISHTEEGCELLLATKGDVLPQIGDVVVEWLRLCSIHSAELWADGKMFEFSASESSVLGGSGPDERKESRRLPALAPVEPSAA